MGQELSSAFKTRDIITSSRVPVTWDPLLVPSTALVRSRQENERLEDWMSKKGNLEVTQAKSWKTRRG